MEVKRPVEPNPATACRRREPSADDARRNGYRNTRIERRHGCVVGTTTAFLERSGPDSTVISASVDIRNKLVGAMSILLTLFRSNVCWAKPNHAFFTVNTLCNFCPPSLRAMSTPANHPASAHTRPSEKRARPTAFSKSASFPLFFVSRVCVPAWALGRHGGQADAMALLAACPPAENFYPTAALPASHEQKCANLLSA